MKWLFNDGLEASRLLTIQFRHMTALFAFAFGLTFEGRDTWFNINNEGRNVDDIN